VVAIEITVFKPASCRLHWGMHIALYQPEIPANTGNIIRLAANTGCQLHLIEPLGFSMDEKKLRRAGLDYHEHAEVVVHKDFPALLNAVAGSRIFACTTKTTNCYSKVKYQVDDVFLFGPETRGLPEDVREDTEVEQTIKIPMRASSRSLNLANSVSIVVYEAWRQLGFAASEL